MATINLRPDQVVLIKELVRQQLERLQDLRIALDPSTFIVEPPAQAGRTWRGPPQLRDVRGRFLPANGK
jgi:hypothetical protein